MAQSVTVTLKDDDIIEVRHGAGSEQLAGYLKKTLDQLNDPKGTQAVLVAKAKLGGTVLDLRKAQAEKSELLQKQAAVWEERSRDWGLSKEIRDLNADRARAAREEARRITAELGE
jgi:hypothetical protein